MIKGLWIYCPSPMFSKTCIFLYFYILSHLFSFWNLFPLPPLSPSFFSFTSLHPHFHKPYPQSKSFLNILAVPSSAVFCNNAVLITPNCSMQFLSFFDVLPSAPTTAGMTLMFLMFHILLISPFSSLYLSIFSFSFLLMPSVIAIQLWYHFSHSYSLQQYLVSLP